LKRLSRPFLVLLAILFLIEAWLWDRLAPLVGQAIAALPLHSLKRELALRIERMSPYAALALFLSPLALAIPAECAKIWLVMHHHWFALIGVLLVTKLIGVGLLSFIFAATREKLLSIPRFAALYRATMRAYHFSKALLEPIQADIKKRVTALRGHASTEFSCFVKRLRRRSLAAYRACTVTPAG
jgi:hypothetical protein